MDLRKEFSGPCPVCLGTKFVRVVRDTKNGKTEKPEPCPRCGGSGKSEPIKK